MDRKKLIDSPEWDAGNACVVCGNPHVQMHHILYGTANRKKSDKHGYIIPLCYEHHLGGNGIHKNRVMATARNIKIGQALGYYSLYSVTIPHFVLNILRRR